jgi:type VI secretion system protein ImpH
MSRPTKDDVQISSAAQAALAVMFSKLAVDATQFDFFNVLRQVDAALPGKLALGRSLRPQNEPLRLTQHASLAFAPSSLQDYQPDAAAHGYGRLSINNFGMFGPNGALPQHLTEYAQEREMHYRDQTFVRFCDIFQHRMILLFYRAWADCQAANSLDHPERDAFGRYASSLVGLGQPSLRNRDSISDHMKLHHAGHLCRQTRNMEGLVRPLAALLRIPVALKEYCLQWLNLAVEDQTRLLSVTLAGKGSPHRVELGMASSRLGQGAIVGVRVPDVQHKFRLLLGAMKFSEFERFLPKGDRFLQVRDWVRNYLGVELAWDARLILVKEEVPAVRLGVYGQLGWTSWLVMHTGKRRKDADDVLLDIERLTGARPSFVD